MKEMNMMDHRSSHISYSIDRRSHIGTGQSLSSFSFKPRTNSNINVQPRSNFVFKPGANFNVPPNSSFLFKPNTSFVYKLRVNNEVTVTNRVTKEVNKEVKITIVFDIVKK